MCNGHPDDKVEERLPNVKYREPMLLFRNSGRGFQNVSDQSGPIFSAPLAGRGLALGDFNNDGSVDVLVAQNNDAPILLRNNIGRQNHWLGVRLIGRKANIDAIGAQITMPIRRSRTASIQSGGRQLPFFTRSENGFGDWKTPEDGLD